MFGIFFGGKSAHASFGTDHVQLYTGFGMVVACNSWLQTFRKADYPHIRFTTSSLLDQFEIFALSLDFAMMHLDSSIQILSAETMLQSLASALGQSTLRLGSTWEVGMGRNDSNSFEAFRLLQTLSDSFRHFRPTELNSTCSASPIT